MPLQGLLARVHEREWVPIAARCEFRRKLLPAFRFEQARGLSGDLGKGLMFADTTKPVFCVAEILFATMHDSVEETPVSALEILRNRVRLIQIIVPQQCGGPNVKRGRALSVREEAINYLIQIRQRQAAKTKNWTQLQQNQH